MPTHRTITAAVLAVAALSAGCGGGSDEEPTATGPSTTAAAATAVATTPAAEPAQPFEGTWQAGPAPFTKVVGALRKAGLGEYAETVIQGNDPSSRLTSELKVQGGYVLMTWSVDDRRSESRTVRATPRRGRPWSYARSAPRAGRR